LAHRDPGIGGDSAIPTLYLKELRSALRERSIVVNSILVPIFLYPVMLWALFTALTFVEGMAEGARSRVVVLGLPAAHRELLDSLAALPEVQLVAPPASGAEAERMLATAQLDVVAEFAPAAGASASLRDNFTVRLSYDRSIERSNRARARVAGMIERHRERWLERQAELRSIPRAEVVGFRVEPNIVTTGQQFGALVLSQLLPLFLVVMVALGCFIPAIDATAGERERSTWETTLTLAAPRRDVVLAKYLYVATLGLVAGVLNVAAMFASLGPVLGPMLAQGGASLRFTLPPLAFPVMILAAFALALFFAAAMMILAAFARTFKEGQGMVTPVYWLALIPLLLGRGSEVTLTPATAAIPVGNVALMMRDAVRGVFQWTLIAQTMVVSVAAVAMCLVLARSILRFEDFLIGSYEGSLARFLKQRLLAGARRSE
jgi:sodium transport system permease protein